MIPKTEQAAQLLTGKRLDGGWIVGNKLTENEFGEIESYSCCYEVHNKNRKGFLKAFDYSGAARIGADSVDHMSDVLAAFKIERDILHKCTKHGCKNVVELLNSGGIDVLEATQYPRVNYLILEYAENGNIGTALEKNKTMEWKLRSLHQLCKGLNEIHKLAIAHNDLTPKNVVSSNNLTKLSDFGSAINLEYAIDSLPKRLKEPISGSWAYAPPELLYEEIYTDSSIRRIGCDLYLLGSMVVYYFTKANMTSLIRKNLAADLCWTKSSNRGKFKELKPYLIMAFEEALEEIKLQINDVHVEEKVILMIRYLCNPDPTLRGHKNNLERLGNKFSLERFVTMLDVLAKHYWIKNK